MLKSATNDTRLIIAAIAALACCNIAIGLMTQVIPLAMEAQGLSARMIGFNAAAGQLGVFISGLSLPLVLQRVSSKTLVLAAMALLSLTLLAFSATQPLYAWYVIRFINGFGIAAVFTLSETWITTAAGTARRARVMGVYTSVLTVTFGVAPFVVAATGFQVALPWFIAAACLVPGLFAISLITVKGHDKSDTGPGMWKVLRKAPTIYACIVATTTFESMSLTFFTIYGMRSGLDYATASQILGTGIIGCLLFFFPIGYLADHWSRGKTATLCASVAIACAILTALTITHWAIWPVTILLRAGAFGVYIVAVTTIGDSFTRGELVSASALVAIGWGVGGMAGAPLAGAVIDALGIAALPWMLTVCYMAALAAIALNRWHMAPTVAAELDSAAPSK